MANEMMRIFFPLKIVTYPEYGSDDFAEEITPAEAVAHEDAILAAIARENRHFENDRGLAEYLDDGPLKEKVRSLYPSVEVHDGELWGVMTAGLTEPLSGEETAELAQVSTNQSSAVTGAQTAATYFPEFKYESYWRLLERTGGGYSARFEFAPNQYSTYNRRTHFTPIWMPVGSFTPYTWLIDCWTPAGMLSMNLTDSVTISGSLWDDWHIATVRP